MIWETNPVIFFISCHISTVCWVFEGVGGLTNLSQSIRGGGSLRGPKKYHIIYAQPLAKINNVGLKPTPNSESFGVPVIGVLFRCWWLLESIDKCLYIFWKVWNKMFIQCQIYSVLCVIQFSPRLHGKSLPKTIRDKTGSIIQIIQVAL